MFGSLLLFCLVTPATATEPPITDLAFAPDGKVVVACSQSGVQIFSWPELKRQRTIKRSAANLHCLAFSPDGTHLAVGGGVPSECGTVEVFSWPDGLLVKKLEGHDDSVRSVAWLDQSRLFTASIDREVKLWSFGKKDGATHTYAGHSRSVDAVCSLKDGRTLVSSGADQTVRVWDVESTKLLRSLSQHTQPVSSVAPRPSKEGLPMIASAAADRTIRFWQPTIGRMVRYVRLEAEPLAIAWLNDGSHIVAACVDGQVRVINADDVEVTRTIPAVKGWAYAIAVHPTDGGVAVGGSDGQLCRVLPANAD
jgi:WD40 repeat protein